MVTMMGLSGHADSYELLHWLEPWKNHPKKVFINHGEPLRSEAMAGQFREIKGWDTHVPTLHETVEL